MSNRSYAILGTGALGGYYGACLQRAGLNLHFLLHNDYDYVKAHGLVVESADGNFTLPHVNAYSDVAKMPSCDVVIVALKTTQNHLLPEMLPTLVKDDSVVLVLQNGLGIEEEVAGIVGDEQVIGGLSYLCANKVRPGYIRQHDYNEIKLGEYTPNYRPSGITERMREIASDFEQAGIPILFAEDLLLARWQKLVWNIPYNGLSVVLNATTQELMADQQARSLVEQLMGEVVAGAAAFNRIISDRFVQQMLDHTEKMAPYRTSMKIDYDAGRPMEVETMFGNPWRTATSAGADLPLISMLYRQLKFLDSRSRIISHS